MRIFIQICATEIPYDLFEHYPMAKPSPSASRFILPGLLLSLAILGGFAVWYNKQMDEPAFRRDGSLAFGRKDSSGTMQILHSLDLEISQGTLQTMQGLMYRSNMAEDQGMLFVFKDEEPRSFWMRNTKISLDIIYADKQGKIVSIQPNTVPYSEEPIPSYEPAQFVVEVNAGYCERKGIEVGDYISVTDDRAKGN